MTKKELELTKRQFKLTELAAVETMGCTTIVYTLLEEVKERFIRDFLIKNHCFNTETVKAMRNYLERSDSFIENALFECLEEA